MSAELWRQRVSLAKHLRLSQIVHAHGGYVGRFYEALWRYELLLHTTA